MRYDTASNIVIYDVDGVTALRTSIFCGSITGKLMNEATFEVRIPGELLQFGFHPQTIQLHVIEWLVLSLFKDERISSGKAAKLLGITRQEFLDLLLRRGVAYIDYSPDEIAEEIETVQQLTLEAAA